THACPFQRSYAVLPTRATLEYRALSIRLLFTIPRNIKSPKENQNMFPGSGKTKDIATPRICDVVWHDGEFIKWNDARVHVMSHVLHYGSSVFEGIRCYATKRGPAIFRLREHMQRFLNSAKVYRMD